MFFKHVYNKRNMQHFTFKELFLKLWLSCMIDKHNNNVKF